ncbi:hypothetical protein [Streptomyces sp. NPDC050388]|uniref:hypothetical protein n=1 Tax=Streptomyces sp. NPDC050388 TaxID=3155781 RepID=UPI00343F4077
MSFWRRFALQFLHHQGAGGVLSEGLVDPQPDLVSWFHPPVDEMIDDEPVRQRAVRPRHKARMRVLHPGGKLKGMAQQPPAVAQVAVCLPQCLAEPDTAHRISPGCSRTSKCSWRRPYRCGCGGRRADPTGDE